MSLHRYPQLWQSLLAKLQYKLKQRPNFVEIEEEMEALAKAIKAAGLENS
jgi:hypothetical protein